MIDAKIHYCWFGGNKMPVMYERCVEGWSEKLPGFSILRWDETNTAIDTPFLKHCYSKKKWAFLSDYIRLRAIHDEGGIYLDADVEIVRDLRPLLDRSAFLGEESVGRVTTGVFGATRGHRYLKRCMSIIDERHSARKPYMIAPEVAMMALRTEAWIDLDVLPPRFFYPYNPYDRSRSVEQLMFQDITADTFAIHHWGKSWKQSIVTRGIKKLVSPVWK